MKRIAPLTLVLLAALASSACAPIIVGGAMVGGALMATDRRSSGAQVDDQAIEVKSGLRIRNELGDKVHVSSNSYNRVLLLTGEANSDAAREQLTTIGKGVDGVQDVINEVEVMPASSLGSRTNDALIATKIKATLVNTKDLVSSAFDVIVERGNVYLMGRVTQREADRSSDLIRTIEGVKKVVRCFEIVTEDQLDQISPKPTK
ncbi:MAG TPA: BON domain-containing protein [Burkholderiaceae bacterium]|jgi:osmotically-inducible protein OsmY